jgi:hypothetical protein
MTQLSEQDRQRIEEEAKKYGSGLLHDGNKYYLPSVEDGYIAGATAERLLAESEKEEFRRIADEMAEGFKGIERSCDNLNPTHEDIWRIANEILTRYENTKKK